MIAPRRPRVLCLQPGRNERAGEILVATSDEWVEALRLHADVTAIDHDFDLDAVCEAVMPDLVVLGAMDWTRPQPLRVLNARSHPHVPRALFLNSDPHDPMRALTFRLADELGIGTVFITGEAYRQHLPALNQFDCCFVPQFVDDTLYRDHGLDRTIPISIFGGYLADGFYPWRARLVDELPGLMPALVFPHPGYLKGLDSPFAVKGEAYARVLGRSRFAVADTTRLDYAVRKHIEIPACGAVLVAPESDALAAYGFVDRENCLLGEGEALYDKLREVARDPVLYETIRRSGMALASTRYTRGGWRLMLDWLDCRRGLAPGARVQQDGRYGPFRPVARKDAARSGFGPSPQRDSAMTSALRRAQTAILTGVDLAAGEAALRETTGWIGHVAEPHFLLGIIHLLRGEAVEAGRAISRRAEGQAGIDPQLGLFDPVETAWLLLIAHLLDNADLDRVTRAQAATTPHVSLRRTRWLLDRQAAPAVDADLLERRPGDLPSVHWLGEEDFTVWCDLVRRVLVANGRARWEASLRLPASIAQQQGAA